MTDPSAPVQARVCELEIPIAAPRARVWQALTEETDAWWLADFRTVAPDSVVTLDARAGGQLLEASAAAGSLLWYTVQMCVPGETLHLVGHLAPAWGGPAVTLLRLGLVERGAETVLEVQDASLGAVSGATAASQESGWRQLFGDGLKAYVESSPAPGGARS